ncbi:MAG: sigma-70 family RNA polymerase sigma factor [Myxococcales bacterium]|nr:sigma-70 family RNA polymerase sigma factor [Myxococcales bacterium]
MQTQAASTSFQGPKKPAHPSELFEEAAFVARLLADEPQAWREFNSVYAGALHRAIGRILSRFGAVTGSDDVREVYAKFCLALIARDRSKLRSFDPTRGARLGSWLTRMAMQATYDHLRRIKRSPVDFRTEIFETACERPDPQEELWERQRAEIVAEVVKGLSAREREFFALYFGQDLAPEVIAARMGISVATVYTKKHKLERRLAELVESQAFAA